MTNGLDGLLDLTFHDEERTHSSFLLQPPLLRHDGNLYGGTAIAASILAMEAATERGVLWVTTQFVAPAPSGNVLELTADTLAKGKRIAQCRVTATLEGQVQFASLGSTGLAREGGLEGQFEVLPDVAPPEDCAGMVPGPPGSVESPDEPTFRRTVEYRHVEVPARAGTNAVGMWCRYKEGRPFDAASIAFAADMVPIAVARAAGKLGAGTSLDNSLRFAAIPPDQEWVLLELSGNMASGGYGHGLVRIWTKEGVQIAIGSQTASMVYVFDEGAMPEWPERR